MTVTRRELLRAAGAGLVLPWLPSLARAGDPPATATPPQRLLILFWGNGINPDEWDMRAGPDGLQLSRILRPLVSFRDRLTFVNGLWNANTGGKTNIHAGQTGNLLTGTKLPTDGSLRNAKSVDRVLADALGGEGLMRAFNVGCEVPTSYLDVYGYSTIYSSHLSWFNERTPVPFEIRPRRVFDAVLGRRGPGHPRILDRLRRDLTGVRAGAGGEDRRVLDGYLDAVRDLERRVDDLGDDASPLPGEAARLADRPESGVPHDLREHQRLMTDLTILALRADRTRVATLLLNNDACNLHLPFLDVRRADYHEISHDTRSEDFTRCNEYLFARIADVLRGLQAVPEGGGTLLDHTTVLMMSSMIDGDHDATEVPLIVAGDCNGAIRPGRVLRYRDRGDGHRKLCAFYVSLLRAYGVDADSFGDADAPLPGF